MSRKRASALRIVSAVTLCLIYLVACDLADPGRSTLDEELLDLVEKAGGARGSGAFILPDGTDLSSIPGDPRNPLTEEKVLLGRLLFHETALAQSPVKESGRGTYSCASCHHADAGFQSGVRQAIGEGGFGLGSRGSARELDSDYSVSTADIQPIRTPSVLNAGFQNVAFWNGQFGTTGPNSGTEDRWRAGTPLELNGLGFSALETQAIAAVREHRMSGGAEYLAAEFERYDDLFRAAFPERSPLERATDETAALAIAAYERTLIPSRAPFQKWLGGDPAAMSDQEKRGAILFFGQAGCAGCHNGPGLGADSFHALGMHDLSGPDLAMPFDPVDPVHMGRGGFSGDPTEYFRYKTPQLYNLADHRYFGHGASIGSVRDVIEYKNRGVPENRFIPSDRVSPHFHPLLMNRKEIDQLESFLVRSLRDPDLDRYVPDRLPSGN